MAEDSNKGWIKLHRKIVDNDIYNISPYDELHAFVDLLLQASFDDKVVCVRGININQNPGEIVTSTRFLAERWKWGRRKVNFYLNYLAEQGCISLAQNNVTTIIKITNYAKYQIGISSEGDTPQSAIVQKEKKQITLVKKTNPKLQILEVFLFKKYLKRPLVEAEKFITYYEKTGWRTATGVKITSKKSAALMWEIKSSVKMHNKELLDKYHKVYLLSDGEDNRLNLIVGLMDLELQQQNNLVIITCTKGTYTILEDICKNFTDKWAKIWSAKVRYKLPKDETDC